MSTDWANMVHVMKEAVMWLHMIDNPEAKVTLAKVEREIKEIQDELRDYCEHDYEPEKRKWRFDGVLRCHDCDSILVPTEEDIKNRRED